MVYADISATRQCYTRCAVARHRQSHYENHSCALARKRRGPASRVIRPRWLHRAVSRARRASLRSARAGTGPARGATFRINSLRGPVSTRRSRLWSFTNVAPPEPRLTPSHLAALARRSGRRAHGHLGRPQTCQPRAPGSEVACWRPSTRAIGGFTRVRIEFLVGTGSGFLRLLSRSEMSLRERSAGTRFQILLEADGFMFGRKFHRDHE